MIDTIPNSALAVECAQTFEDARNEAYRFFKPYLEKWLPLQLRLGKLDAESVSVDLWSFDEKIGDDFYFNTLAYQNTDDYYSVYWVDEQTTSIPAAFFDNPILYAAEQFALQEKAEASSKERTKQAQLAHIKALEDSLVAARVQFANTYNEG